MINKLKEARYVKLNLSDIKFMFIDDRIETIWSSNYTTNSLIYL